MLLLLPILLLVASAAGKTDEQRIIGIDFGASRITSWYFEQGKPILVDRLRGSNEYCSHMSRLGHTSEGRYYEEGEVNRTIVDLFAVYVKHMENIAAARLDKPQRVRASKFPLQVIQSSVFARLEKAMMETSDNVFMARSIPSRPGAGLTAGKHHCHWGWKDLDDIDYDTADEVLVIESYLDELWAKYLQLTNNGPLGSDHRPEAVVVKADHRELTKAIGQVHRTSSKDVSSVVISGDFSSQEVDYIKSNVSLEVPYLKGKFKTSYAGPEHVTEDWFGVRRITYQELLGIGLPPRTVPQG